MCVKFRTGRSARDVGEEMAKRNTSRDCNVYVYVLYSIVRTSKKMESKMKELALKSDVRLVFTALLAAVTVCTVVIIIPYSAREGGRVQGYSVC